MFDELQRINVARRAGLEVASVLGDVAGLPFEPSSSEFAVIARRSSRGGRPA